MADSAAAAADAAFAAPPSSPPSAMQAPSSDSTPAAAAKTPNLPDTPASADPDTPFSDATPADASDADASAVAPADADAAVEALDGDDDGINASGASRKQMTLAPPAPPSKKSKKKNSNCVWTRPASRKGKKKAKQPAHALAGAGSSGRLPKPFCAEDEFILTPAPRLAAERNDDGPDLPVLLSRVFRSDKVDVSEDRLTAGGTKGYRMVRATRGVATGAWYFEIKVLRLGPTGHARLGWATNNSELHAPVGYDAFGFAFRDMDGAKVHKAWRDDYAAEGYGDGDVIGFYIHLPDGEQYEPKKSFLVQYKGMPFHAAEAPKGGDQKKPEPDPVPGSEICFFKNGVCQGTAFLNIPGGRYYPAASMYTLPDEPNCEVRFNFGPDFEFFPEDFGGRPVPQPMNNVPYQPYELKNEGPAENGTAEKTRVMRAEIIEEYEHPEIIEDSDSDASTSEGWYICDILCPPGMQDSYEGGEKNQENVSTYINQVPHHV